MFSVKKEVLNENNLVIYIDTSIRFGHLTKQISSLLEKTKSTGIAAPYINLNLTCYTDKRMFEWFGSKSEEFNEIKTVEANFLVFRKSLVLDLIMKAWVTCALEESCIAPKGAHIYGGSKNWGLTGLDCSKCGCHRFENSYLRYLRYDKFTKVIEVSHTSYTYTLTLTLTTKRLFIVAMTIYGIFSVI